MELSPLINGQLGLVPDIDPEETQEWVDSLDDLIENSGGPRARYILMSMERHARRKRIYVPTNLVTPYINTIPVEDEPFYPGDEKMEREFRRWVRWNAAVQVTRAQRPGVGVGGHISSFAADTNWTGPLIRSTRIAARCIAAVSRMIVAKAARRSRVNRCRVAAQVIGTNGSGWSRSENPGVVIASVRAGNTALPGTIATTPLMSG